MATKIQLTPQELLAQSQEMFRLREEYGQLFQDTQAVLTAVNENWSANLSHNFAGKLLSAQKGFSQILGMLENGGNLAALSASSYESVDSLLSREISGESKWFQEAAGSILGAGALATGSASLGLAGNRELSGEELSALEKEAEAKAREAEAKVKEALSSVGSGFADQMEQDWENVQSALDKLEDLYNQLPQGVQDIWEFGVDTFGGVLSDAWDVTMDIVHGNLWDAWEDFVQATPILSQAYDLGEYIFCGGMLEDAGNVGHLFISGIDHILPESVDNWFESNFNVGIVESWESGWESIGDYWSNVGDHWAGKLNDFTDGVSDFFSNLF